MKLFRLLARGLIRKITGDDLDEFNRLRRFRERFRTRVYMSTDLLLPDPARGKFSYGYEDTSHNASYCDFENIFRGDEEFIKNKLHAYDSFFHTGELILEIGCGRGEFLELLEEKQISYVGVDLDDSMIKRCREKGMTSVVREDFEVYLKGIDTGTFDGIFSAQFIEHIEPEKVSVFFKQCHAALKPGGVLVAETVNPYCIEAFRTFHVDLSHHKVLYPEVLLYNCMVAGYKKAAIFYPNHGGFNEAEYDEASEYAVVAYK